MMDTLAYIKKKYSVTWKALSPHIILGVDRVSLAELFCELGFTKGVEVGVDCGLYSEVLCKSNPDLTLYCVDPWLAYEGYLPGPLDQVAQDKDYEACIARLAPYSCVIIRKTSMDALSDFEDNSLDFVYIDGNHVFEYVVNDLAGWTKKVRPGGIISGHDYMRMAPSSDAKNNPCQVIYAVNGWVAAHKIKSWFILGANEKPHWRSRIKRDRYRSWMWVKK